MWRIILIAAFPYIFGAAIKPMEPLEGPLWREKIAEALLTDQDLDSANYEIFQNRLPDENLDNLDSDYTLYLRPPTDKRALAIFNRWGSITGIGKNRPPIRSSLYDPEDSISAQPRGRMPGQPLRWG